MTTTFEEVRTLVHQLTSAEKVRLTDELAAQLGDRTEPRTASAQQMTLEQAHQVFAELRNFVSSLPQPRRTLGEQLESDRAERQASIEGGNVHPRWRKLQ
ncbi:MAG: hypothetical protein MUD01_06820 [Chloroflexaceae bacterium]|jgi:hypothetical protein|nr:hypothetical protein [Chloroflexaceae bacterium]